tara:strand:+ start:4328 stop:4525 length:198 start_codon:yes stop_codon:yes gene_type:complete
MQWNHLTRVCMTYRSHFVFSAWVSLKLLCGSARALCHALCPPLFAKATTELVVELQTAIAAAGCR